jgi:uncharacterized membrane protein YuzA (DUF378 family)
MKTVNMKMFDIVVYGLLLIGALNWGLVGFFGFDLVAGIFGKMSVLSRLIYAVVGLAAVYDIFAIKRIWRRWGVHYHGVAHA